VLLLQVRYQEAHPSVLSAAAKLGAGKAQPALQLIGYEQEVEAAVKYAFGTTFVCQVGDSWGPTTMTCCC
jgi:structural maintenance of chromosome 2